MEIVKIKKDNLSMKLTNQILELIKSDVFKPGDKIPSIKQLSEKMAVGQGTTREALKQLQVLGIVKTIHGRGSYITSDIKNNSFSDYMSHLLVLKEPSILFLIEARKIIEIGTVQLAAKRAVKRDIKILEKIINRMEKNIEKPELFAKENTDFHVTIAQISKNYLLSIFFNTIYEIFLKEQKAVAAVLDLESESLDYHKRILNAIKERNSNNAGKEMDAHLTTVENRIKDFLKKVRI